MLASFPIIEKAGWHNPKSPLINIQRVDTPSILLGQQAKNVETRLSFYLRVQPIRIRIPSPCPRNNKVDF